MRKSRPQLAAKAITLSPGTEEQKQLVKQLAPNRVSATLCALLAKGSFAFDSHGKSNAWADSYSLEIVLEPFLNELPQQFEKDLDEILCALRAGSDQLPVTHPENLVWCARYWRIRVFHHEFDIVDAAKLSLSPISPREPFIEVLYPLDGLKEVDTARDRASIFEMEYGRPPRFEELKNQLNESRRSVTIRNLETVAEKKRRGAAEKLARGLSIVTKCETRGRPVGAVKDYSDKLTFEQDLMAAYEKCFPNTPAHLPAEMSTANIDFVSQEMEITAKVFKDRMKRFGTVWPGFRPIKPAV